MMIFDINLYVYEFSSELIELKVCSFELSFKGKEMLNVIYFIEDIVIIILIILNIFSQYLISDIFFQFYKMKILLFYVEKVGVLVIFIIEEQRDIVIIEVFVRFGFKFLLKEFDRNYIIFFDLLCLNSLESKGNEDDCQFEVFNVIIFLIELRLIYFGFLYLGEKNYVDYDRRKRLCLSDGREK